jgi:hypothetical protein
MIKRWNLIKMPINTRLLLMGTILLGLVRENLTRNKKRSLRNSLKKSVKRNLKERLISSMQNI